MPRMKILQLFMSAPQDHLSAEEIYRKLLSESEDVGLATIYRVLTQFEHAGLLVRHHFEEGKAVFELDQGRHHDHLVCLQCGKVEEFYDEAIEHRQCEIAEQRGFLVQEHALYLYVDCLKKDCPYRETSLPSN
ncbi:MAG: ferric iron uptake transcriptional regulator [Magnetococcales bacterium]|nr:ferric iron uptake transcriptional regulator [Magnetococcales bacterium]